MGKLGILFLGVFLSVSAFAQVPNESFFHKFQNGAEVRFEITQPVGEHPGQDDILIPDVIKFITPDKVAFWPQPLHVFLAGVTVSSLEKSHQRDEIVSLNVHGKSIHFSVHPNQDLIAVAFREGETVYNILINSGGEIIPVRNESGILDDFLKMHWTEYRWKIEGQYYRGLAASYPDGRLESIRLISEENGSYAITYLSTDAQKMLKNRKIVPEIVNGYVHLIPEDARFNFDAAIDLKELKSPKVTSDTVTMTEHPAYVHNTQKYREELLERSEQPHVPMLTARTSLTDNEKKEIKGRSAELRKLGKNSAGRIRKYLPFAVLSIGTPQDPAFEVELAEDIAFDLIGDKYPISIWGLVMELQAGKFVDSFFAALIEAKEYLPKKLTRENLLSNPIFMGAFGDQFEKMLIAGFRTLPEKIIQYTEDKFELASYLVFLANRISALGRPISSQLESVFDHYLEVLRYTDKPGAISLQQEILTTRAVSRNDRNLAVSLLNQNLDAANKRQNVDLAHIKRLVAAFPGDPTVSYYAYDRGFKKLENKVDTENKKEVLAFLRDLYKVYPADQVHKPYFGARLKAIDASVAAHQDENPMARCNSGLKIALTRMEVPEPKYFQTN